jgi:chemotaxis signal transduction protein
LACVIVDTDKGALLMPDVVVAEVVGWQAKTGQCVWRERHLPVLDVSGGQDRVCLLVCHGGQQNDHDFWAISVASLPRMMRIRGEDIHHADAQLVYSWQRGWVSIDGKHFVLPDFEALEEAVIKGE